MILFQFLGIFSLCSTLLKNFFSSSFSHCLAHLINLFGIMICPFSQGKKDKIENKLREDIYIYVFDEVDKCKYLGVMIVSSGERYEEIREKLVTTNRVFHLNKKLLRNKSCKIRIYRRIIQPSIDI